MQVKSFKEGSNGLDSGLTEGPRWWRKLLDYLSIGKYRSLNNLKSWIRGIWKWGHCACQKNSFVVEVGTVEIVVMLIVTALKWSWGCRTWSKSLTL